MIKLITLSIALSLCSHTALASMDCSDDGPPWDPCQWFASSDVPDNPQAAKAFIGNITQRVQSVHKTSATITQLAQLGLLGGMSEQAKNGAALELLMWEAGYTAPKRSGTYQSSDFYNGIYGQGFTYLIKPFSYHDGWGRCQALRFKPTLTQGLKAKQIINAFKQLAIELTTPYKSTPGASWLDAYNNEKQANDHLQKVITHFDYSGYMSYALLELNRYTTAQRRQGYIGGEYINMGCSRDIKGRLTRE